MKQVCASVRKAFYKLNKYAPFTMFGIQSNEKGDEFARTCILLFKTYFSIVHTWLKLIGNAFFQLYKVYHGNNNSQNTIYEVRCKT